MSGWQAGSILPANPEAAPAVGLPSLWAPLNSQGPTGEPSAPPFLQRRELPQKCPVTCRQPPRCSPPGERARTPVCVPQCPRLTSEGGRRFRALALTQLTCFVLIPFIYGQQQTRLLPGTRGEEDREANTAPLQGVPVIRGGEISLIVDHKRWPGL